MNRPIVLDKKIMEHDGVLRDLAERVRILAAMPFQFVRSGYADELSLHFGPPIEVATSKRKLRPRGSYVLSLRASHWLFETAAGVRYSSDDFQDGGSTFEADSPIAPGSRAVRILPEFEPVSGGIGLDIEFDDGSRLEIRPDTEECEEVADWELLGPAGEYLGVGPGAKWADRF